MRSGFSCWCVAIAPRIKAEGRFRHKRAKYRVSVDVPTHRHLRLLILILLRQGTLAAMVDHNGEIQPKSVQCKVGTVLVLSPYPATRYGLEQFLKGKGFAASGVDLFGDLPQLTTRPSVVILDIESNPAWSCVSVSSIHSKWNSSVIIVISTFSDRKQLESAIYAGATGLAAKESPLSEIEAILKSTCLGHLSLCNRCTELFRSPPAPNSQSEAFASVLTDNERALLSLVADGLSSKEIADRLSVKPRTLEKRRELLSKKLNVRGLAGLIRYAVEHGVLHYA